MRTLQIQRVGGSLGVVLPEDVLAACHIEEGDDVTIIETEEGLVLRFHDADLADQLKRGRAVAERYGSALDELAK